MYNLWPVCSILLLQEIYPPKLQEFAYVTDGACDEDEILEMELIMLKALNWDLCPETPISWVKLYAQLGALKEGPSFLVPQFSQETYIQMTQVCVLILAYCFLLQKLL